MNLTFIGKIIIKNPLYFWVYADLEADNEIDNSSRGNRTTNIYKQYPIPICYHVESELDVVLKSGYYKAPLGNDNVDRFVNEVKKIRK